MSATRAPARFEHMTDDDLVDAARTGTLPEVACDYARRAAQRWATNRCGTTWARAVIDDAAQEAVTAALEAIAEYGPDEAGFGAIVGARVRRSLDELDPRSGTTGKDRAWRQVEAVVAVIGKEREAAGLPVLSGSALADAVWERFVVDRAGANATTAQRKVAERALTRRGVRAVVFDHLTTVVATGTGPVSLDRPDDDGGTLADTVAAAEGAAPTDAELVEVLLDGMVAEERKVALGRFGLGGVPGASYEQLAETHRIAKHEAKDIVGAATRRLSSPHVWFARFSPTIEDQFDKGPVDVHDVAGQVVDAVRALRGGR